MVFAMWLPSLEELAEKWTTAHTIAVAAWVVVLVLGAALLVRNSMSGDTYPATDRSIVYAAENATFAYPANWTVNDCSSDKPFIELPGTILSNYKDQEDYELTIYGAVSYECVSGRPERLDLYPEDVEASDDPCAPGASTEGERLDNGLYLQLQEFEEEVYAVHIKQNRCYAPEDAVVMGFAFLDPEAEEGDQTEFGPTRVDKEVFLESPQYEDIREVAASIKY